MSSTLTNSELRAAGSDLVAPVSVPSPEPVPTRADPGRRYRTAEGLAARLEAEIRRASAVLANLRAHPPADESSDLARAASAVERVSSAVTALDHALGWRGGV